MKRQVKKVGQAMLMLAGLSFGAGCGMLDSEELPAVQPKAITCNDVFTQGVSHYSETDVAMVLELEAGNKDQACWLAVVQSALTEGVRLPQAELKRAIKELNAEQYNEAFHLAVYHYLATIARGQGSYRLEDKALLRAYCSYLINHAENRHDDKLAEIQLLTKRVDPDMYDRYFK